MADGPNTNSGSKVASALNSIPFGNIIGGPLAAYVLKQRLRKPPSTSYAALQ